LKPVLLSITIPTYNRADFLRTNLEQLNNELKSVDSNLVEVLISDNCSQDNTKDVVNSFINDGFNLNYIRNEENKGWGFNFFQCFNKAKGKYVLILSDDDLLYDGSLKNILTSLKDKDYGVICMKAYGFDKNFRSEFPFKGGDAVEFDDFNNFFKYATPQITLLSASIFNKDLIKDVNTETINPGNFAHLHLILRSASLAKTNLFLNQYLIASKRDNSSNYIYSEIFVKELWSLFEHYRHLGLTEITLKKVENKLLLTYYPADLLRLRLSYENHREIAISHFSAKFSNRILYKLWVAPILKLPKTLAVIWGAITVIIGKILNGELYIVIRFLSNRVKNR
jgi:abequosyltransferase